MSWDLVSPPIGSGLGLSYIKGMETPMESYKRLMTALEGLRVGLKAFIFTYLIAFLLSLIVNLSVIEKIQDYLQGTLSAGVGFDLGLVVKSAVLIMNVSVFNSSGTIQLGLLVFGFLPFIAFFFADRNDNRKEGMDLTGAVIYVIASMVFTLLLTLVSYFTQGNLLGMAITFVSWRNAGMTFVITLLIQVAIGMNYNMNRLPGIIATRWMVRLTIGTTAIISGLGLVGLMIPYTRSISLILLAMIVLVPNLAIYLFFMMFGVGVDFNESLEKLMAFGNIDLSYSAIPVWGRLLLILLFVLFAGFSVSKIDKDNYRTGILGFTMTFSLISLLVAYCTVIDLGVVKGLMDIRLGISPIRAFLYPAVGLSLMSVLYTVVLRLVRVVGE